jgi:transcriptional regulator with XRE-family HTH domain
MAKKPPVKRLDPDPRWHVGDLVVKLRAQNQVTQDQLAERAHLNRSTLGFLENQGRSHESETLEKIATAFGLTVPELYARVPGVTPLKGFDALTRRLLAVFERMQPAHREGLVDLMEGVTGATSPLSPPTTARPTADDGDADRPARLAPWPRE